MWAIVVISSLLCNETEKNWVCFCDKILQNWIPRGSWYLRHTIDGLTGFNWMNEWFNCLVLIGQVRIKWQHMSVTLCPIRSCSPCILWFLQLFVVTKKLNLVPENISKYAILRYTKNSVVPLAGRGAPPPHTASPVTSILRPWPSILQNSFRVPPPLFCNKYLSLFH